MSEVHTVAVPPAVDAPGDAARRYVEIAEGLPIPEEVDWDDAPSQFKLYRGRPRLPLGYAPRSDSIVPNGLSAGQVGQLLLDCYGLTRYRWTAVDALRRVIGTRGAEPSGGARMARNSLRPVPSGGSRFPAELYVVAGEESGIPAGVYQYDAPHHALVTLREGNWTPELAAGLGRPAQGLTLLASVFFWKNAFKYGELTYRLCGLDLGVLIGQILTVARRYELPAEVRYQFVDDDLDRLLGLDPLRESVYAAVTLGGAANRAPAVPPRRLDGVSEVPRTGTGSVSEQDWTLDTRPAQARVHRAARLPTVESIRAEGALPSLTGAGIPHEGSVRLSDTRVDPLAGLRARRSSMGYFVPADLSAETLSALLSAATGGYANDLDGSSPRVRHTTLFCAVNRVSGIEPGVYWFRPGGPAEPRLERVTAADLGAEFQDALLFKLFNLTHTNVCVYPVGDYESGFEVHGDRWYRVQNMEAGIVTQRLYLASAALGLRCHASLGYDVRKTNGLLGLGGTRLTSLIQVMIGAGKTPGDFYEAAWQ